MSRTGGLSTLMNMRLEYVLLASDAEGGYTPFQGFGDGIADPAFALLVDVLAMLPASPFEIFDTSHTLVRLRAGAGRKHASLIGPAIFTETTASENWSDCILVIIALPSDIDKIDWKKTHPNAIVVTTEPRPDTICVFGHDHHIAQLLDDVIRRKWVDVLPPTLGRKLLSRPLRARFPNGTTMPQMTGAAVPNEILCMALGHSISGAKPVISANAEEYVDAIISSAERARTLIGETSTDIVLYAPSILRHLYAFDSGFWNGILRKIKSHTIREIIKDGVFRNKGYSGFAVKVDDPKNLPNPYQDQVASTLLQLRQTELRLVTAGVTALVASGTQPAYRLPNAVNFCAAVLREIEQHAKRNDTRGRKFLQDSYIKLARKLSQDISPKILRDIESHAEAITLVTDAPLEWLRIGGLPLMIRHETSRIGMTPGNLMFRQCIDSGMSILPASQLKDVLVIRSFSENDPVRGMLENAVIKFELERIRVRFVDVSDRASLVARLNEYQGMLVVFDCHGDHGGGDSHGWLRIGKDRVDPWSLAGEARIPPIVVLSACSTFALAGSHASVASGLLRSGAITVLGTFLPVSAILSAILVARVLYRIDAFLPALRDLDYDLVTWRSFITGFLRMSYATDLLHYFIDEKGWVSNDRHSDLGLVANQDINALHPAWYEKLLAGLAEAAGKTIAEMQASIDLERPLLETMYYCQVGRPENIGIYLHDPNDADRLQQIARRGIPET